MKRLFLLLTFLIFLTPACKKDKKHEPAPAPEPDKKEMLENIGTHIILPSFLSFYNQTDSLLKACQKFVGEPTEANLIAAQNQWKEANDSWKQCELFRQGPIEDQLLGPSIDTWPVNAANLETVINTAATINNTYMEARSIYLKGLKAIEYFLFSPVNSNAAIIDLYTNASLSNQRKAYLVALTENLRSKALLIYNSWNPAEGNSLSTFMEAAGTDVGSSLGKLVNQMVLLTEVVIHTKTGIPLGKMDAGTAQPSSTESPYSATSLEAIKKNLLILESTFLGRTSTGQDLEGIDDLLNAKRAVYQGQPLAQVIKTRFAEVKGKFNTISPTLEDAVVNNPQKVEEAYLSMKNLLVLLKLDMPASLGVLITFTDNDGD